jgi:hypothetical protein
VGTFPADGKLYVTWNPTVADNGAPLRSYVVTATGGGRTVSTRISADDFARTAYSVVDGLSDGTAYTVTVRAVNAAGASPASLPSAPATPVPLAGTLAGAPTNLVARASTDAVSLRWNPPTLANTGDTPVIGYRITVSDGRTLLVTGRDALVSQPTTKTMTRVVAGLRPGTGYTFTIAPVTATGVGAAATIGTVTTT